MNKELEEAKDCLKETIQNTYAEGKAIKLNYLLNYIDNSISKEVIKDKKEENRENERYYDEENIIHDEEYYRIEGKIEILEELLEQK